MYAFRLLSTPFMIRAFQEYFTTLVGGLCQTTYPIVLILLLVILMHFMLQASPGFRTTERPWQYHYHA